MAPAAADLYRCVHCGFCLPNCPTYIETGLETASPRGRLALMKAMQEGRVALTPRVQEHMELCVQCRACEAVCPSGVPFGRIMEATRAQIVAARQAPLGQRLARFIGLRMLLPRPWLMRSLAWALKAYQRSGLQWAVREYRLLRVLSGVDRAERQLPRLGKFYSSRRSTFAPGAPPSLRERAGPSTGRVEARVAMLTGCVMPLAYGRVHEATVRVLERNGCQVAAVGGQGCCGALHAHSGDLQMAGALARKNIDAFLDAGVEAVVVNSAGCGAAMKEYCHLLKDDPAYREKAARFSALVKDVHEHLVSLPFTPPKGRLEARVTYQDSCHLAQAQRIKDPPRRLLRAIPGLRLVEMTGSEVCCGAGGAYAFTQPEMSGKLLEHKLEHASETQAAIIATANPGCAMQLEAGLRRSGSTARIAHVIELLDEAYRATP